MSSVAEELALNALVQHAQDHLDPPEIPKSESEWDDFYEWAYEDGDWELLFDQKFDGIENDSSAREELSLVNLEFSKWFVPFASNYPAPHPFAAQADD